MKNEILLQGLVSAVKHNTSPARKDSTGKEWAARDNYAVEIMAVGVIHTMEFPGDSALASKIQSGDELECRGCLKSATYSNKYGKPVPVLEAVFPSFRIIRDGKAIA